MSAVPVPIGAVLPHYSPLLLEVLQLEEVVDLCGRLSALCGRPTEAIEATAAIEGVVLHCLWRRHAFSLTVDPGDNLDLQVLLGVQDEAERLRLMATTFRHWLADWPPVWRALELAGIHERREAARRALAGWRIDGSRIWLTEVSQGFVAAWTQALGWRPPGRRWSQWPLVLPGRLVLCRHAWTAAEIRSMRSGDFVLTGLMPAADQPMRAQLCFGIGQVGSFAVDFTLEDVVMQVTTEARSERDDAPPHDAVVQAPLSELQIPVSFEIDTVRVRLSELEFLRPGSMVSLPGKPDSLTVKMVCQGQVLAQGQLVVLNGALAICLTRLSQVSVTEGASDA